MPLELIKSFFSSILFSFSADVKAIYEKALSPPEPSPPPTPTPKRSKADWERDERELAEEMEGLEALRTKKIPKYFDSEFGKAFLLTQVYSCLKMKKKRKKKKRTEDASAII